MEKNAPGSPLWLPIAVIAICLFSIATMDYSDFGSWDQFSFIEIGVAVLGIALSAVILVKRFSKNDEGGKG